MDHHDHEVTIDCSRPCSTPRLVLRRCVHATSWIRAIDRRRFVRRRFVLPDLRVSDDDESDLVTLAPETPDSQPLAASALVDRDVYNLVTTLGPSPPRASLRALHRAHRSTVLVTSESAQRPPAQLKFSNVGDRS